MAINLTYPLDVEPYGACWIISLTRHFLPLQSYQTRHKVDPLGHPLHQNSIGASFRLVSLVARYPVDHLHLSKGLDGVGMLMRGLT